MIIIAI